MYGNDRYEYDDGYDPNQEAERAYERDCESRLAQERDREWQANIDAIYRTCDEIEATVKRIRHFLGVEAGGP